MICRGPGSLAVVVRFGSWPTPSPPPSVNFVSLSQSFCVCRFELTNGRRGRERARSQPPNKPLNTLCGGWCWDWTQDCCDIDIGNQTVSNHSARSHPQILPIVCWNLQKRCAVWRSDTSSQRVCTSVQEAETKRRAKIIIIWLVWESADGSYCMWWGMFR